MGCLTLLHACRCLPVCFWRLQLWEARDVDTLARKLEDAAGAVTLKWTTSRSSPNASTMDKLVGGGGLLLYACVCVRVSVVCSHYALRQGLLEGECY